MKDSVCKIDQFPHCKTCYEKRDCLTKACSTIKVTHIPGFITTKTYANVAVSPVGTRGKYMPHFGTGTSRKLKNAL